MVKFIGLSPYSETQNMPFQLDKRAIAIIIIGQWQNILSSHPRPLLGLFLQQIYLPGIKTEVSSDNP